jgi:hypothetical protein
VRLSREAGWTVEVSRVDAESLVLADGDEVTAWGRLVRDDRAIWFEPPLPVPLVYWQDPPVRRPGRGAVTVAGASLDHVADRRERDGLAEGWATLTGTWSSGGLEVVGQDPRARPADDQDDLGDWDVPPCPPPTGGWPRSGRGREHDNLSFDLADLEQTGAAVAVTTFRPGKRQLVLVVAAADIEAVEAQLRPQLGARLCVVPSQWTRPELRAVLDHLSGRWEDWNIYSAGEINTSQGQAQVTARLARVLPEMAAWAAPLPDGILALRPWLIPGRAGRAD